ncbi:MAG: DUF87 domain-containing protein [Chloroflexota bacterium]|nr:DUF87 domain-containing protein [Chloroflexota bacterium]MDE2841379.1 DUF87 domain-containing protein [Chloroflexota bacterium]MDE2930240.1 DUF87 domain-containing protein [Chloroflexota bacterium]
MGQRRNRGDTSALILLGKCIEQARVSNKFDSNVWLDIHTPHVVFVCGRRGTGKSYDLGILAEGLTLGHDSNIATKDTAITTVFFDTQNQFWALLNAPDERLEEDREQLNQLEKWGIPANQIPSAKLFAPSGDPSIHPNVVEFAIDPTELELEDWCGLFGLEVYSPQGQLIRNLLNKVARDGYSVSEGVGRQGHRIVAAQALYDFPDLIACLKQDIELSEQSQRQTRDAILWKLEALRDSKVFQKRGWDVLEVLKPGQLSIFLLRNLDDSTKSLVVSIIAKKIFRIMGKYHTERKVAERAGKPLPQDYASLPRGVWTLIDEAHIICPSDSHTAAKPILIEYVKRGRDAGLSLVLATQQPSAVDSRVVSQVDLLIAHRLVVDADISAALARVPADFPNDVSFGATRISDRFALVRALETGEAWVADAETNRAILLVMRPRVSAHGGDEPKVV